MTRQPENASEMGREGRANEPFAAGAGETAPDTAGKESRVRGILPLQTRCHCPSTKRIVGQSTFSARLEFSRYRDPDD